SELGNFSNYLASPDCSFVINGIISYEQLVDMIYENGGFRDSWTISDITLMIKQPDGSFIPARLNNDSPLSWIYYYPPMSFVFLYIVLEANTQVTHVEDHTPSYGYGGMFGCEGTWSTHAGNFGEGTSNFDEGTSFTMRGPDIEEEIVGDEDFSPGEDDLTDETSETESDRSINEESEQEFIKEHPFPNEGLHVYREMGEWDPSCVDRDEYALPLWNGHVETIRLHTVFRTKEEAQTGIIAWNVENLRAVRTKDSNKKSFKVVCRSSEGVPCMWKAWVSLNPRVHDMWEVTEWTDRHTCMQVVERNDHKNVTATMISNLLLPKIQKQVTYSVEMVQADVKKFKFVFWAFGPAIRTFHLCPPIISIDGTHLR
ncbi:Unknown protein, partial [Striga hermonthica]